MLKPVAHLPCEGGPCGWGLRSWGAKAVAREGGTRPWHTRGTPVAHPWHTGVPGWLASPRILSLLGPQNTPLFGNLVLVQVTGQDELILDLLE